MYIYTSAKVHRDICKGTQRPYIYVYIYIYIYIYIYKNIHTDPYGTLADSTDPLLAHMFPYMKLKIIDLALNLFFIYCFH